MMVSNAIDLAREEDFSLDALKVVPKACMVEADGKTLRVEPKVMEMLILLARANGTHLSREHLIEACWDGRAVTDDAVTRALSKVRKIAALTAPAAFRIETRPKIGVRLVTAPKGAQTSDSVLLDGPGIEAQTSEPLLIVFPFENRSTDPDLQFFSDGVSEEVLGRIMRGSKLKVVGPTSSFQYRGAQKAGAAEALKATHIVDGSIRRAGNRVRINAHLTETASGAGLWAEQFERDLGDIFALQDEIADGIAQALFTKFTPAKLPPIDPATYDLYLRAKSLETNPDRLQSNIASLERVTRQAPEFADGWGRLATLRAFMALNLPYKERATITSQSRHDMARSQALDPQNHETTYANYWTKAPFGAFLAQDKIIALAVSRENPSSDDLAIASFHCYETGQAKKAHHHSMRAHSFDPSSWAVSLTTGISLWGVGQGEAARDKLVAHIDGFTEDQQATAYLLLIASWLGDWDQIDRLSDPKRLAQFPLRENSGILATAATMRYPTAQNREFFFGIMKARVEKLGFIDSVFLTFSSLIGMSDAAYPVLDRLPFGPKGAKGDPLGMMGCRAHLLFTPANKDGRNDARFVKLCARLGLVEFWLTTGIWPDCADEVPYDFRAQCRANAHVPCDAFAF